jgi:arginine/ornithine N-succinyltransferase beta subunit
LIAIENPRFQCMLGQWLENNGDLVLDATVAEHLKINAGDSVRVLPLTKR